MIGGCTTFAHDFFITPADGKSPKLILLTFFLFCISDEVEALALQKSDGDAMLQRYH